MKWSALLPRLLCLALVAAGVGCGGQHDAMEKQLTELRDEVVRLRSRQAQLTERLDAIDIDRGAFAKNTPGPVAGHPQAPGAPAPVGSAPPPAPAAGRPSDPDRPDLDVVRLSPSEGDGDADNDPSRPVVRAVGDGSGATKTLSNKNLGGRSPKKGVTPATSKKTSDADARPGAKP